MNKMAEFGKWGVFDCTVFMPKIKGWGLPTGNMFAPSAVLFSYQKDYDTVIKLL